LRQNGNLSTGGSATDVTDRVHPENAARAVDAARVVGLDIAGVDVICRDVTVRSGTSCPSCGHPRSLRA
jgi:cyanophycin synthetase